MPIHLTGTEREPITTMSVYTTVSRAQLESFLQDYEVGALEDFSGISAGIENTNYFVDTTDGHWVLTLFERQDGEDLPYFLGLMDHLAGAGLPSARPVADADGRFLTRSTSVPRPWFSVCPAPASCSPMRSIVPPSAP